MVFLTNYPSGAGDGYVANITASSTWAAVRAAANGTELDYTGGIGWIDSRVYSGTTFECYRGFFPVDTSGIGAGATVTAAVLHIFGDAVTYGTPVIGIVQSTTASTTTLANADYSKCGAVDSATEATDAMVTVGGANSDNSWTFNTDGLGFVKVDNWTKLGAREQNDLNNNTPGYDQWQVRFSEYTGTNYDPYLAVTYTSPPVGPANLKTYNTNVKANIKTINTNVIANVKSLDTNV